MALLSRACVDGRIIDRRMSLCVSRLEVGWTCVAHLQRQSPSVAHASANACRRCVCACVRVCLPSVHPPFVCELLLLLLLRRRRVYDVGSEVTVRRHSEGRSERRSGSRVCALIVVGRRTREHE